MDLGNSALFLFMFCIFIFIVSIFLLEPKLIGQFSARESHQAVYQ